MPLFGFYMISYRCHISFHSSSNSPKCTNFGRLSQKIFLIRLSFIATTHYSTAVSSTLCTSRVLDLCGFHSLYQTPLPRMLHRASIRSSMHQAGSLQKAAFCTQVLKSEGCGCAETDRRDACCAGFGVMQGRPQVQRQSAMAGLRLHPSSPLPRTDTSTPSTPHRLAKRSPPRRAASLRDWHMELSGAIDQVWCHSALNPIPSSLAIVYHTIAMSWLVRGSVNLGTVLESDKSSKGGSYGSLYL